MNIVRLLYHLSSGTRVYETYKETGWYRRVAFLQPPEKFITSRDADNGEIDQRTPKQYGITPRQIRYFFKSYPDKPNQPIKNRNYIFLDDIRNFFIQNELVSETFFDSLDGKLTKGRLNRRLTKLIERGIINKSVTKVQYRISPDAFSNMSTYPRLREIVTKTDGTMVSSNYCGSLIYPVPRVELLPMNKKKLKIFKQVDLAKFEEEIFQEIEICKKKILMKYIEKLSIPGETIEKTIMRLGINYSASNEIMLFFGKSEVGNSMPIIIFDPLPGRIGLEH